MTTWYDQHVLAYELWRGYLPTLLVTQVSELNEVFSDTLLSQSQTVGYT